MTLTPLWVLGWENGLFEANVVLDPDNTPVISNTKDVRAGGYSLRCSDFDSPAGRTVDNLTEMQAACWFNHNGVEAAGTRRGAIFSFVCADGRDFIVSYGNTGNLTLRDNSSAIASVAIASTGLSIGDTWFAVSAALKIDASNGYFAFYGASGQELLLFEGDTGSSPVVAILFGGRDQVANNGGWDDFAYFGDCRALDATGEGAKPASARQLLWAKAAGNGQLNEWEGSDGNSTDNYLLVDDGVTVDGDTTYVMAESAGPAEQYAHAGITIPENWTPRELWPTAIARKTDAVDIQLEVGLYKSGSLEDSDPIDLSTAYDMVQARLTALPDASTLNEANINAAEIRVQSAGSFF